MINIDLLIKQKEYVDASLENRGEDSTITDKILEVYKSLNESKHAYEKLRQERNVLSQSNSVVSDDDKIAKVREIKSSLSVLEKEKRELENKYSNLIMQLPNVLDEDTPVGKDEDENVILYSENVPDASDFKRKEHWDIEVCKRDIDFERGVKLSGSRFYVLKNKLAQLQRALIYFLLEKHNESGYTELNLPYIVQEKCLLGAGQLPKFEENLYHDHKEDFWLIPTSEVSITYLHANELFASNFSTINYCSYSPCFRREKMSAGRDVRGIKRGHQFDKVELYKICHPDESKTEHEKMLEHIVSICKQLKIPYRIKLLCSGDIGFAAMKTYDVELWAAGSQEWLEVSSISNCGDFQGRRSKVRIKDENSKKNVYAHTLNGSAFGIPRVMIAILENYQQADGSVAVPDCLQKYVNFKVISV
ncbi:serine--tRNA ligase [Chryseobacterium sp. WLY505]|uniref:serine--tRNA ligase n=1 Tax=Chryseobacterium sp. WLY505 TaxID=3068892 RepID=UPI002796ABCD|nr:serine--tRNA ligase [Chryseobacterium sp. WLY505]MDQ1858290.1 serine--tRNA ligase [Chryseobacterium sp. WLY505]